MSQSADTTKATVVDATPVNTDTIVREKQQAVNEAQPTTTSTAENVFGKKIDVGGQVLGIGFYEGVLAAYTNLIYNPYSLVLMTFSLCYFLSIMANPLEPRANIYWTIASHCTANEKKANGPLFRMLNQLCAYTFDLATVYANGLSILMAMWFPYFAKPSTRNAKWSILFSIIFIIMDTSSIVNLSAAHGYFLSTQLRSPAHKSIIIVTTVAVCMFGVEYLGELLNLAALQSKYKFKTTTPTTPSASSPKPSSTKT